MRFSNIAALPVLLATAQAAVLPIPQANSQGSVKEPNGIPNASQETPATPNGSGVLKAMSGQKPDVPGGPGRPGHPGGLHVSGGPGGLGGRDAPSGGDGDN